MTPTGFVQLPDALFRALTESTTAAVFVLARDRFQYVNPAFAALAGYSVEQLLAVDPYDLVHPDSLSEALRRFPAAARSGASPPARWEMRIRTRGGDSAWLALATKVIEVAREPIVVGVGMQITETTLEEARQSPTFDHDAASEFTRGLAHDLNDVLQIIQGHTDRIRDGMSPDDPLVASSDAIRDASARAAELTQDLLEYSRHLRSQPPDPDRQSRPPTARPVVLLVEDEEPVRRLIGSMLERHGFDVVMAASGEEGLRLEQERRIDLLLSDVMLPGRNGFQVASEIRQRSPHVRVIFMSGYAGEAMPATGLDSDTALIQKPFKMADLMTCIRDALWEPGLGGRPSAPIGR